jgi:hypothetical protein
MYRAYCVAYYAEQQMYYIYFVVVLDNNKMNTTHDTYIRAIDAQQAIMCNICENRKIKLLKKN